VTLRPLLLLTLTLALLGHAAADATPQANRAELDALLAAVAEHPAMRSVNALGEAAELRRQAVFAPVAFAANLDFRRAVIDAIEAPPGVTLPPIDPNTLSYGARVILRPYPLGDLADLADQRALDVERARLQARETRARLEAQAIEAALAINLSELGVALAERGLHLAEAAERGTLRRAEAGGASAVDVGRAELARREAHAALADARANRDLARARAATLIGDLTLSGPVAIDPIFGVTPDVVRASLDLAAAQLGARNAARSLAPQLQGGYTWLLDDGATLTLALESRTLQPTLSYASNGGAQPGGDLPGLRGAWSIGVSWSISTGDAATQTANRYQIDAAEAALALAAAGAEPTRMALAAALTRSETAIALAALDARLSAAERDAEDARFASGASSELARLSAELAYHRAQLALARAHLDHQRALLDTYTTYATPLSEVLP
jgi:outer membrane protein